MNVAKVAYKPVSLLLGVAGGALAGFAFGQVWKAVGSGNEAPQATEEDRGWGEVLLAATLRGAVFALVKASVDRGGATAARKLTGTWPG